MNFVRAFIRDGDTTTVHGTVQARPQQYPVTLDGKHACFEGDPVFCPACKSTGITKCVPPFRRSTGPDGRQGNLDGDLCLCKCAVPPRLVARFHNSTMGFSSNEIMSMPAAAGWMAYAGHTRPLSRYDEFFVVHDSANGLPVQGFCYGIATESGEHHDALYDDGATAKAYAEDAQPMSLTYLVQTRMEIRP